MKQILPLLLCLVYNLSAQKHVFYLHGRIVEIQGAEAFETSNGYGAYQYQAILDSLSSKGLIVHSELRPASTKIEDYALKISIQIKNLLAQGVAASDITVIGASKGAAIAMSCSAIIKNRDIRYVWLAGCCETLEQNYSGRILSIYESSDACGTCSIPNRTDKNLIAKFEEIQLNTGLRHGFIYGPRKEWLSPALAWIFSSN